MRTHPVTTERMADIQNRLSVERYRQHVDSVEFTLLRAGLEARVNVGVDGLARARASIELRLRDRSFVNEAAAHYRLAVVANEQGDHDVAREALAATRTSLGASHAMLERLAIDIDMRDARHEAALAASTEALAAFPSSRALVQQHGALLLRMARFEEAANYLESQVRRYRADSALWRMLSEARFGAGQPIAGRRAAAEHYALDGGLLAAIEQLRIAQREAGRSFYVGSQIDARLRELQARYTREQASIGGQ